MTSLGARIAALLIVAIVTVVALATFAASITLSPPSPEATMEPLAAQLQTLARLAEAEPDVARSAGVEISAAPAEGAEDARMTRYLAGALRHIGETREARIVVLEGQLAPRASVRLADGSWMVSAIPDLRPPPGRWRVLTLWLALIAIGSGGVALYAAWLVVRPLRLLEDAAARIGSDGILAHIPETGAGEIRATARALNQLSARLQRAMESRMRLVAAAGHDLRTPMTRMRLRAEFIEDEEERAKWLADLEELDLIADSAIRLVREEAGGNSGAAGDGSGAGAELVRLDRLLAEIVENLAPMRYRVEVGALPALSVRAGPLALKRAVQNLVINAATHGGGARIALGTAKGQAVVVITDDGPGIPEEVIGQVFEPFFRVDPARRKILPGAGLGMAIAREIVERFGGTISIRNRQPRGLEQRISLPLAS